MASTVLLYLQNLWPFSLIKTDDLKLSNQLVQGLSIPNQTKQFIFAAREPDSNATVYILAVQNLSEQSAVDADQLIKQVHPTAVVTQVAPSALAEIQAEEKISRDVVDSIPTSSLGVLKRCLLDKMNKEDYDKVAGCQMLEEIFGIGFYGHFLAAKRAAKEVNSHFLVLESPYENACTVDSQCKAEATDQNSGLNLQSSYFLTEKVASSAYSSSRRFCLTDSIQTQMVKSLIMSFDAASQGKPDASQPKCDDYQAPPPFAESVYPLLADLNEIFNDFQAIREALACARKMLMDVNKGEPADIRLVSKVHNFRIAVECLRVALNNAARCPANKMEHDKLERRLEFSELPSNEKCHVLFAQALRSQARKFGGSVVAIVDASSLAGLRRHWNTPVPPEVAILVDESPARQYLDDDAKGNVAEQHKGRKHMLSEKPVVLVGTGATSFLGVTSLSQALTTYKVSATLKLSWAHFQRQASIGFAKIILGPSKLTATLKLTASAEKIRAVTHTIIASAEKMSLLAVRTSFYEIMRRRRPHGGGLRFAPWATFSCSMAACSGLVMYGDGIECAAESIPSVNAIASLGRGLKSFRQASQKVRQTNVKIQVSTHPLCTI